MSSVQTITAILMLLAGIGVFLTACAMMKYSDYSEKAAFEATENELDYLNQEVSRYVSKLLSGKLSTKDSEFLSYALKSVSDLELVGDYAAHMVERGETLQSSGEHFSSAALEEIDELGDMVGTLFGHVIRAYENEDEGEVYQAGLTQLAITDQVGQMSANHVRRVSEGKCSPDAGTSYLAVVSDIQHAGSHFYSVAKQA